MLIYSWRGSSWNVQHARRVLGLDQGAACERENARQTDGTASHFKFPVASVDSYLFPPGATKKELLPLADPGDRPSRVTYLHYIAAQGDKRCHIRPI